MSRLILNALGISTTFPVSNCETKYLLEKLSFPETVQRKLEASFRTKDFSISMLCSDLNTIFCKAIPLYRIRGGKGGFGAALKAQGKTKVGETTDFGSCRDLNGNRLRAANNRKRKATLLKALESANNKPKAIKSNDWHIEKPSWIDSRKTENQKKNKTSNCVNYTKHRKCLRGKYCTFKHDRKAKYEREELSNNIIQTPAKFSFNNLFNKVAESLENSTKEES